MKTIFSLLSSVALVMLVYFGSAFATVQSGEEELAKDLATLFRSARAVISSNQKLINDASLGDKGLTADKVVAEAKVNYEKATGRAFVGAGSATLAGQAQQAMFESIAEVMNNAQAMINEPGKGFKGFLPAIFARQVAQGFSVRMDGKLSIKLTAPKNYVRNRANRPDTWESDVIEMKFRSAGWETNKPYSEVAQHKGKQAFRFILPEYYKPSCLGCHGTPKGDLDITGGRKEGGTLGELGGAISVVIYQ